MSRKQYNHLISEVNTNNELTRIEYLSLDIKKRKEYRKKAKRYGFANIWIDDYSLNDLRSQSMNQQDYEG